jgi:hypothetical protein
MSISKLMVCAASLMLAANGMSTASGQTQDVAGAAPAPATNGDQGYVAESATTGSCNGCGGYGSAGCYGKTTAECVGNHRYAPLPARVSAAHNDPYNPWRGYAYGRAGIDATRIDAWQAQQAQMYPWHGAHYHRQYGAPLALVVPPTASYQTIYSWGVAQTRSVPIYHQFQASYSGGGVGGAGLLPPPYWPSNTTQFGVYPVRGPW